MDPVTIFLLSVAGIFLLGTVGEIIFQKTNIPDVVWLILAGMILGPIGGILPRATLESIAPYFAAITIVVVLFDGGSALKLGELSKSAPRSSLLALLAFIFSALAVAVVSMLAAVVGLLEDWSWMHGLLLGAILGGSSSVIIMPAMARANLSSGLSNLVNLESALTDALCVVTTVALVDAMRTGSSSGSDAGIALLKSFGIGLAMGLVAGLIWVLFLRFLHSNEHAYPVTLSALLILYVLIDKAGGSAALGILTVAVILGNAPGISQKIGLAEPVELDTDVRGYHRQMTFIIKSFFFVFIGAMLYPPWLLIIFGVLMGGVLLAARIPAVFLATLASGLGKAEKKMAVVSMPRGMAAGVLATVPVTAGLSGTAELPVVVFAAVLTTILVFAAGFPVVKRELESAPATNGDVTESAAQPPSAGAPQAPAPEVVPVPGAESRNVRVHPPGDEPPTAISPGNEPAPGPTVVPGAAATAQPAPAAPFLPEGTAGAVARATVAASVPDGATAPVIADGATAPMAQHTVAGSSTAPSEAAYSGSPHSAAGGPAASAVPAPQPGVRAAEPDTLIDEAAPNTQPLPDGKQRSD